MKKTLFLIWLFVFFSSIAHSQTKVFALTPYGFINPTDSSKKYVVLELKGKNKADLFKKVLLYINKTYVSPKDVVSKVEEESITVNGFAKDAISRKKGFVFDMNYTINFEFKDEKIKVSAPSFTLTTFHVGKNRNLHLVSNASFDGEEWGIWNDKLVLKSEMAKEGLEKYFNKYITKLLEALESNNDW